MKKSVDLPPDLLKKEIEMQTRALNKIRLWINLFLLMTSVGILLIYLGVNPDPNNLYFLIPGVILTVIGALLAIVVGYGFHNGKRNVEKMIAVLEKHVTDSSKNK